MESRYREEDARRAVEMYGVGEELGLRTYTARLLGSEPSLVLHGGGNTSVKGAAHDILGQTLEVLYVKGSGWDLATIEPPGHPAVRLEPLRKLRALPSMSDEAMVNSLRTELLDASAPTPSVETLLHAFLPTKYVDHTHADAVLALADQPRGQDICAKVYGAGLVWVPYVMPGFELALRCAAAFEAAIREGRTPTVMVLERHGVFTFGETAKDSYQRMIDVVTRAERRILDHQHTTAFREPKRTPEVAPALIATLRGAWARLYGMLPEEGPIVSLRTSDTILSFLERHDAKSLVEAGCATPDHVLRTKPTALLLAPGAIAKTEIESQLRSYAAIYDSYFAEMIAAKKITRTKLDPLPRVVLSPGVGILCVGMSKRDTEIAADVYEHTIDIMAAAADVGEYSPVSRSELFDVEYWSLEQAKLKARSVAALSHRIIAVTGAASGIGLATARTMAERGAHVLLIDRDGAKLAVAEKEIAAVAKKAGAAVNSARADVTSFVEVRAALERAVLSFGGLDVVVSNAGNAPHGHLDTQIGDDALRASLETNLLSHANVARAAMEIFRAQATGGSLLFNASKSAFAPGPEFGPYAVAKAGLVALMRQYAIDGAPLGVRSNAVNADRIRTDLFGNGVAEARAQARGLTVDQYFRTNLLGREVTATDVADAFAYLASARATTGSILTVDGGNPAAFPR